MLVWLFGGTKSVKSELFLERVATEVEWVAGKDKALENPIVCTSSRIAIQVIRFFSDFILIEYPPLPLQSAYLTSRERDKLSRVKWTLPFCGLTAQVGKPETMISVFEHCLSSLFMAAVLCGETG